MGIVDKERPLRFVLSSGSIECKYAVLVCVEAPKMRLARNYQRCVFGKDGILIFLPQVMRNTMQ